MNYKRETTQVEIVEVPLVGAGMPLISSETEISWQSEEQDSENVKYWKPVPAHLYYLLEAEYIRTQPYSDEESDIRQFGYIARI